MPILTIEAIRENPWNVLSHELPPNPSLLLLRLARMAADYCRRSENLLMFAVLDGEYLPVEWQNSPDSPDAHEFSEALAFNADEKYRAICELMGNEKDENV
jgi:hypothetical protein